MTTSRQAEANRRNARKSTGPRSPAGKAAFFMGGWGSGWQGAKKATVESSLVLAASSLVRKRALVAGAWTSGSWCWTHDGEDKPHATIGYEADLTDQDNAWLRLHYTRNSGSRNDTKLLRPIRPECK